MRYRQAENIQDLKEFITTYHTKRQIHPEEPKATEADLQWDAARFWAIILHRAHPAAGGNSLIEFNRFAEQYNLNTAIAVDIDGLLNRFWLREVCGHVNIAKGISTVVRSFEETRKWKNELQFVCEFHSTRANRSGIKLPVAEVEAAVSIYEQEKGVSLNKEGIYNPKWGKINEANQAEFSAMDIYFSPLLHYWADFEFLYQWKKYIKEEDLIILKIAFEEVSEPFRHFANFPDAAMMESQGIIKSDGDFYRLQFYNLEISYWQGLQDKIGGYAWEYLLRDDSFANDKERVITWLKKNLTGNRWSEHLDYTRGSSRERFLDASMELILEQQDIAGCETEFEKLLLDSREYLGIEVLYREPGERFKNYKLNNENLFELYHSLDRLEEEARITYLHDQPARVWLAFLVQSIVRYDSESSRPAKKGQKAFSILSRVLNLLREGKEKPFLVWRVSQTIRYQKPVILPFLLAEPDTCTLALSILDEVEFYPHAGNIQHQYWVKALNIILDSLPQLEGHATLYTEVIFQIFRQLMAGKYKIPYNRRERGKELQTKRERDEREKAVLSMIENAPVHKGLVYGGPVLLILPEIFMHLAEKFINFHEPDLYNNGTTQFPMLKWDALFWLMKITTDWKLQQYFHGHPEKVAKLADAFFSQYLENLEKKAIKTYDHFERAEIEKFPYWSEKIERLELLDWIYPIYFINERGNLSAFLTPRLDFETTTDQYNEKNRFNAEKLRTHIGVLLQILRKLMLHALPYGFDKNNLVQIKEQIERQVVEYLRRHSKDIPAEGRVDLFSYKKEWAFKESEKEALLPQIARAINWFSKKDGVINAIASSGDLIKLLTLLDHITSEGVKALLLEQVRGADVAAFLEQKSWIPEIQETLVKLSHYPELLPQIEQAIAFWKQKVVRRRTDREYKERLFLSELLVAYFKHDEQVLEAVEEPGEFYGSRSEPDFGAYKAFYRGLLFITDDPERSIPIFDDLARRYPAYPTIALNRMVAKLRLGLRNSNPATICREAYEEWNEAALIHFKNVNLDALEPELSANLMEILLILEDHKKIEEHFNKLELPVKMTQSILEARVKSLIQQKQIAEALLLIDKAKTYHQFSGHTEFGFLRDLEATVSGEDNIEELSLYSQRIFTSPPPRLIRTLPRSFNGKQDIHEFLVKEIVNAADKMLEKIRSIDEIQSEDKYNDLVELVLDSRLNALNLHVDAQGRGAFSDSKDHVKVKQPARRDLPIVDNNKKVWLVCEALIYRGEGTVTSHLRKIFNSHHQRQAFVMLYYDNATIKKGFEANWKELREVILPAVAFPTGMEIQSPLEDVSREYDCKTSAIKVGKTIHGNDTIVYHIFVNIKYELTAPAA